MHLSILAGVAERFATPFFDNLKKYAQKPVGTFHALPVARGKSIFRSNWIRDMGEFYGPTLFLAESSATTGGLDSLLEPTGNIKLAQDAAARAFGADKVFFVTNGTSTSNKMVYQALCQPGDIVIVDRNCHKSHHYGMVLAGAQPYYVEAFPLTAYSMYGSVPLRTIKAALLELKAAGRLSRVKMVALTNVTFDGHMYDTVRVMEECLAIKPDLIFLWDEAWFGFARWSWMYRRRTAMGAREQLRRSFADPAYLQRYLQQEKELGTFFDTIVVCTVTGSTHAGMIAGFAALEDAGGRPRRVLGIDASATLDKTREQVGRIARSTAQLIGVERDLRDDEITVLEGWAGDLYGIPVESTIEAIKLSGRLEGMIIDPVYEGKSMAGLVDLVDQAGGQLHVVLLFFCRVPRSLHVEVGQHTQQGRPHVDALAFCEMHQPVETREQRRL